MCVGIVSSTLGSSPSGCEKKSQHEHLNERLSHLNAKAKACMILTGTNIVEWMKAEMGVQVQCE